MAMGELEKAVRKLAEKEKGWKEFLPGIYPPVADPIPDSAGKAQNVLPKSTASGGDLTESTYAARTYYPRKTLKSTDGIITWLYDPIKTIAMTDASGNSVTLKFAEPTT